MSLPQSPASGPVGVDQEDADRDPGRSSSDPQALVAWATSELCPAGAHGGLTVLLADRPPETIAATDDLPVRADWLQHELREGPLLGDPGEVFVCHELAEDARWPAFGKLGALVIGVRSLVCVQLSLADGTRLAFSAFSERPGAFDGADAGSVRRLAEALAPAATLACGRLRSADPTTHGNGLLPTALGIVMAHHRVLPARAFELLDQAATDLASELFEVALEVVLTGRLPTQPRSGG